MHHVYCIEALADKTLAYKIGRAAEPKSRVREMQVSNHALLQLVTSFPCADAKTMEKFLHSSLELFHIRGEWFEPHEAVRNIVVRCATVFQALTETQNDELCRAIQHGDGWLYRHIKQFTDEPLPVWLRLSA